MGTKRNLRTAKRIATATQPIRAYKERTELEKKRFMKNSEKMWGVR